MIQYRILTLDGGGIRGLFTARLLERIEAQVPGMLNRTNLIAGTSTGSILALGLASGMSPGQLARLYLDNGEAIFDDSWLDDIKDLGGLSGSEYDNKNLKRILTGVFGGQTLGELPKPVLVPAFDLDNENADPAKRTWTPKFFHNFPGSDTDGAEKVVDVALASSAAPTYFPTYRGYIDGGVCANNPSLAALLQTQDSRAQINPRPALDEIALFSVGTGVSLYHIKGQSLDWGYAQWAKPLISLMLDANAGIADYQCRQLMGDRYTRLAPVFAPDTTIKLDDWERMNELVALADGVDLTATIQWFTNSGW